MEIWIMVVGGIVIALLFGGTYVRNLRREQLKPPPTHSNVKNAPDFDENTRIRESGTGVGSMDCH